MRVAVVGAGIVGAATARALERGLAVDLLGASYFPDDLQCDPRGIARAMAHEAGVRVRTGTRAERILPGEGVRIADGHEGAGVGLGPLSGELVAAAMC